MSLLDKLKREIEPQDTLIEDLKAVVESKKKKAIAVEYVISDGRRSVVLINSKSQVALVYDSRDQLNMGMRMIWGTESEYSDFIHTAASMSKEVDTNRYHIFANAFTHSPMFVEYIDVIYKDYSLQKLVELNKYYEEDEIKERNIVEIPANDATRLGFFNESIEEVSEELQSILKRESNAIERIGVNTDTLYELTLSDAIGLDQQEDTDKVLIAAAEAEDQTIQDIKEKSTGFLFVDLLERLARANERGWVKLSLEGTEIDTFNSNPKPIPEYNTRERLEEIEGLDSVIKDNEFINGVLDRYKEEDERNQRVEEAAQIDSNETDENSIITENEVEDLSEEETFSYDDSDYEEEQGEDFVIEENQQDTEDSSQAGERESFGVSAEDLFNNSDDNETEEETFEGIAEDTEDNNTEGDQKDLQEEYSETTIDEDINYEVIGSEEDQGDEEPIEDFAEFGEENPPQGSELSINNGFKEKRPVTLPESFDKDEISLISTVDKTEVYEGDQEDLSYMPVTPEGVFKSLGISTNDFSTIFEDLIKEKQNAERKLESIPSMIGSHQNELAELHSLLDDGQTDVAELEEELEDLRVKRDEIISEYDRVSEELDEKSAQVLKKSHRIRQISVILEKLETEQEFYSNTLESAERALNKAKNTNPQTVASFTDVLDRIQNGDIENDLLPDEVEELIEEVALKKDEEEDTNLDPDQIASFEDEGGGVVPAAKSDTLKFRGDFVDADSQTEENK